MQPLLYPLFLLLGLLTLPYLPKAEFLPFIQQHFSQPTVTCFHVQSIFLGAPSPFAPLPLQLISRVPPPFYGTSVTQRYSSRIKDTRTAQDVFREASENTELPLPTNEATPLATARLPFSSAQSSKGAHVWNHHLTQDRYRGGRGPLAWSDAESVLAPQLEQRSLYTSSMF